MALGLAAVTAAALAPAALSAPGLAGPRSSLPQTLRGTVQVPQETSPSAKPVDTLRELYPALSRCWRAPSGLAGFERVEITARLSLRRDGSVIGEPRITFTTQSPDSRARAVLTEATLDAIRRCAPVSVTPALGGAIAGRPIALRFIYTGPKGQGV